MYRFLRAARNTGKSTLIKALFNHQNSRYIDLLNSEEERRFSMKPLPQDWSKNSPQKNTPKLKELQSKKIVLDDQKNIDVLQVELLVQLAERRLIADDFLDQSKQSKLPNNTEKVKNKTQKNDQMAKIITQLRHNHILVSKGAHDNPVVQEFHYRQQLIKPHRPVIEICGPEVQHQPRQP